jgi:cationic amino acid transporter 4
VFDLEKLVEFMSIGTLLAYTIVSASVIILRYRPPATEGNAMLGVGATTTDDSSQSGTELPSPQSDVTIFPLLSLCYELKMYSSTVTKLAFHY